MTKATEQGWSLEGPDPLLLHDPLVLVLRGLVLEQVAQARLLGDWAAAPANVAAAAVGLSRRNHTLSARNNALGRRKALTMATGEAKATSTESHGQTEAERHRLKHGRYVSLTD